MTKKRYRKLMYALMQKIHARHSVKYAGRLLKAVQQIEFKDVKFNSYAEAWDSLKDIRSQYGM